MVENGTRVSAYNTKKFVFLREKSVGDPAVDLITTLNIPAWVSHEPKVTDRMRKVSHQKGVGQTCYVQVPSFSDFCMYSTTTFPTVGILE